MLEFGEVKLKNLIIHKVGNSLQEEGIVIAQKPLVFKEDIVKELLLKYFLSPFKGDVFYNFDHETDLNLNELFCFCSEIFDDPDSFFIQSVNIAKHLYSKSNHHNIKGGEFYLVYFENVIVNNDVTDAIGLFKSENKETYLKVFHQEDSVEVEYEQGVNINKLDKGCLIFNLEREKGYKLCIVDNTNKSQEAQYWKNDFLKIKQHQDNYFHTEHYLHMCKNFFSNALDEQYEVEKADKIMLMNKSVNYFVKKESFNVREFENEVMEQPELIEAFKNYKEEYKQKFDVPAYDEFEISDRAVKQTKKIFKSVIKLDKNFHIYIHGNRDYIQKGFDEERGLSYYQVFFKEES
ncbi:MAG: nucleoid-associated protein [Cytophagaceae bacterium]